jgi:hypothetical protein
METVGIKDDDAVCVVRAHLVGASGLRGLSDYGLRPNPTYA